MKITIMILVLFQNIAHSTKENCGLSGLLSERIADCRDMSNSKVNSFMLISKKGDDKIYYDTKRKYLITMPLSKNLEHHYQSSWIFYPRVPFPTATEICQKGYVEDHFNDFPHFSWVVPTKKWIKRTSRRSKLSDTLFKINKKHVEVWTSTMHWRDTSGNYLYESKFKVPFSIFRGYKITANNESFSNHLVMCVSSERVSL